MAIDKKKHWNLYFLVLSKNPVLLIKKSFLYAKKRRKKEEIYISFPGVNDRDYDKQGDPNRRREKGKSPKGK